MKRLLVCLDASPRAPQVLATAAALARQSGAKLCLLRAVGVPAEMHKHMSVQAGADLLETMTERAKAELEELARDYPDLTIEGVHVHAGVAWDTICREAEELDCDLVVLGSHGHSGLDRILGTTAAKVVNHCQRSVLVARGPAR